jgi:hypothetical protein
MVGRQHELGLLRERFERTQDGEGQVVLLSGEAGIGKSRLVRALGEYLAEGTYTSLAHHGSPFHTNSTRPESRRFHPRAFRPQDLARTAAHRSAATCPLAGSEVGMPTGLASKPPSELVLPACVLAPTVLALARMGEAIAVPAKE